MRHTAITAMVGMIALAGCGAPAAPETSTQQAIGALRDGHHDIVWQWFPYGAINQGQLALWHYDGATNNVTRSAPLPNFVGTGWNVRLDGDFYGDGGSTLLLQEPYDESANPGQNYLLWHLNGFAVTDTPEIAANVPGNWTVVSAIDVDDDGVDDIIWQDENSGAIGVWFMHGNDAPVRTTLLYYPGSPTTVVLDAGHFDQHQVMLVLWDRAKDTISLMGLHAMGQPAYAVWHDTPVVLRGSDPAWREIGVGDVNGDGDDDIWWYNPTTGQVGIWWMWNFSIFYRYPGSAPLEWTPIQIADYDGDGRADVLWRDSKTTDLSVWRVTVDGTATVATPDLGPTQCKWLIATLGTHGDVPLACASQGAPTQACYRDGSCDPGIDCVGGTCLDPRYCGPVGQECCASHTCDNGGTCASEFGGPNVCLAPCGGAGQQACVNNWCRVPGGYTATDGSGHATEYICDPTCGSAVGEHACDEWPLISPQCKVGVAKQQLDSGKPFFGMWFCQAVAPPPPPPACGTAWEPCCAPGGDGSVCGGTDKTLNTSLECRNGTCTPCGLYGEQCCVTPSIAPCGQGLIVNNLTCKRENGGASVCVVASMGGTTNGPSLMPYQPGTMPLWLQVGEQAAVVWSDLNFGNTTMPAYVDRVTVQGPNGYQFSQDVTMSGLGVGALSKQQSVTFQVPSAGSYLIDLRLNANGVAEADAANNEWGIELVAQ